jgi:RimJ/RimL family protein N-acetyltransferase
MYTTERLKEQMMEKQHRFYIIQISNQSAGFVSVNREDKKNWFINKFYIDQALAGKGAGTEAFNALIKLCDAERFALTVNRQNYKAVNFYFKLGFKIASVADFDIGAGYVMNDFVMNWKRPDRLLQ